MEDVNFASYADEILNILLETIQNRLYQPYKMLLRVPGNGAL